MATKRSNPFIEDFVPQSKVHVGLKQFNNNEERLRNVYEKTIQLLFEGAKKSICQENLINHNSVLVNKKDRMKQLVIGKDGCLLNSKTLVQDQSLAISQCSCRSITDSQCAYCETALCDKCQCYCLRCENVYCSHCSVQGSEGSEICVSCYG